MGDILLLLVFFAPWVTREIQSAIGLAHSKCWRRLRAHTDAEAFWSAAVLCRFGWREDR